MGNLGIDKSLAMVKSSSNRQLLSDVQQGRNPGYCVYGLIAQILHLFGSFSEQWFLL
jgi:hypothetical protein